MARLNEVAPNLIRIAFIKFGGLSAGGTEKFLQTIAANLDRAAFSVDYFYCDSAPYIGADYVHPTTDAFRLAYMQRAGVNLIKFKVGAKDIRWRHHPWRDTDFFDLFDERNYDIVQTGRAGHREFPFTHIRRTPIVDSLHLAAGADNQANIARVMHISEWSAQRWIAGGGDARRVVLVSHPMEKPSTDGASLRAELGLAGKFVFGFHQRASDEIFSPVPLSAYRQIAGDNTHFLLLGGSELYREQARELGLTSATFLPHSADPRGIAAFLATLDVYAHGRKDGEVNSTAIAEAMGMGLPVVSHISPVNNGHIECIGDAGRVVGTIDDYAGELRRLHDDPVYRASRSAAARRRFAGSYELTAQIKRIERIYRDVVANPFPNRAVRVVSGLMQDVDLLVGNARAAARIAIRGR